MTNEQYLFVSYFASAAAGVILAGITIWALAKPHRQATDEIPGRKLGGLFRRLMPSWLVLAVLLAFLSVSYFDCSHENYAEIVADRPHLVTKTHEQISAIFLYLAIALIMYGFTFILFLWARARRIRGGSSRLPRSRKP